MHMKPKTLFWAWKYAFQPLQETFHEKIDRNSLDFEKIIAHGQIFSIDLLVGGQKYRRAFTLFQFHTRFKAKIGYFLLNECHFGFTTKKLAKPGQIKYMVLISTWWKEYFSEVIFNTWYLLVLLIEILLSMSCLNKNALIKMYIGVYYELWSSTNAYI